MLQCWIYVAVLLSVTRDRCGEGVDTHCMNFKTALVPHGSLSGRSNVFPKRMSSAERGTRNLPSRMILNKEL